MSDSNPKSDKGSVLAGRIWKACMGLVLMAVGSIFCWYLWASWQKAKTMDSWGETEARIIVSQVLPWQYNQYSRMAYQPKIRYEYEFGGKTYTSERIRKVPVRSSDESKAKAWVEKYPAGMKTTAFVDPADPKSAVLKRDTKAAIYSIWFPMLFVVGGAGIIVTAFLPRRD